MLTNKYFATALHERTLSELERLFPGRAVLSNHDWQENWRLILGALKSKEVTKKLIKRFHNECKIDQIRLSLPQWTPTGATASFLLLRIIQRRFESLMAEDFLNHARVNELNDCTAHVTSVKSVRRQLDEWAIKNVVQKVKRTEITDQTPGIPSRIDITDARMVFIIPSQRTMVDFLTTKTASWIARIAIFEMSSTPLRSDTLKDWLFGEIGLSPDLLVWAKKNLPGIDTNNWDKTANFNNISEIWPRSTDTSGAFSDPAKMSK